SGRPLDALLEAAWLLPDAEDRHAAMLRALGEGGSGTVRQPYRGTDSLWAYAGAPGLNVALLMIVPFEEIARETDIAERRARELTRRQLAIAGGALATVMLIVVALAFAGARSVTRPVRTLLQAARDVAAGDFDRRVDIRSRDEFGELGAAFNEMVPQLKERMEIRQSLEVAQEVQQHLLPTEAPVAPGLDVAGRIDYADETGGDYYDFLTPPDVPEGEVGIAVGDATGHGVAAALLMAGLRAGLRNAMVRQDSLDLLAARLNRQFARDAKGGRFMTLTYMQIDGVAREARWISAGHDPILFYDPVADAFEELDAPDIPLGIDPERAFRACRRGGWPDGGLLVFGTDGVWEARNPHGEMFGKERLKDAVRARRDAGAAEICAAIGEVLERFRAGRPAADDVTLVVVRFLPPS
ncbi:MAG: SpoIIE family protein phosphatase, partial [Acetobacterales bacterium]